MAIQKEAPKSQPPAIQPDEPMNEAGRQILRFHLRRMRDNEPGTRLGEDIEALHDMRVATRRMRSALRVFGPYYQKAARRWISSGLRQTGRALGAVRDLDVLLANTEPYVTDLAPDNQQELDPLLDHWRHEREVARSSMLAYLDSSTYADLVSELNTFCETPGAESLKPTPRNPFRRVKHAVPGLLVTLYGTVRAYEGIVEGSSLETLHALRIQAKRLRYALEFFRHALGDEASRVIDVLVQMQDHLGALNDARVAHAQASAFAPEGEADHLPVGSYMTYLDQEIQKQRDTFPSVWQDIVSPETRHYFAQMIAAL